MLIDKEIKFYFLENYLVSYRQYEKTIFNDSSKEVAVSIHNTLQQQIVELKKHGVSDNTLMFLYKDLYKNYRFLRTNEFDMLQFVFKNNLKHKLYFMC